MTSIGRYQITGPDPAAMGDGLVHYDCMDPVMGRSVEIRAVSPDANGSSAQARMRLVREARHLSGLEHPAITKLLACEEDERGHPYLVLERFPGQPLAQLFDAGITLQPMEVLSWVTQIAAALDHAHGKGTIHRNVTPESLWIGEDGQARLSGFELAHTAEDPAGADDSSELDELEAGAFARWLAYLPPEALLGDEARPQSDQFALAACAFRCLAGETPFASEQPVGNMFEVVFGPARLDLLEARFPGPMLRVFERALAKVGAQRFSSCTEFANALSAALAGKGSSQTRVLSSAVLESPTPAQARSTGRSTEGSSRPADSRSTDRGSRPGRSSATGQLAAEPKSSHLLPLIAMVGILVLVLAAYFIFRSPSEAPPNQVAQPDPNSDSFKDAAKEILGDSPAPAPTTVAPKVRTTPKAKPAARPAAPPPVVERPAQQSTENAPPVASPAQPAAQPSSQPSGQPIAAPAKAGPVGAAGAKNGKEPPAADAAKAPTNFKFVEPKTRRK